MTTPNPPESATEAQGRALSDGIHSCSYFCARPECIRAQRDELRDKLFPTPTDAALSSQDAQALLLERWGRADNLCIALLQPASDGYWTPWHIAQKALEAALTQSAPQAQDAQALLEADELLALDKAFNLPAGAHAAYSLHCEGCGATMAEHDRLARCPEKLRPIWHEVVELVRVQTPDRGTGALTAAILGYAHAAVRAALTQSAPQASQTERERCAALCDDEARLRTEAGQKHPEESAARDRCFAGARAAMNCARAIRSGEAVPLQAEPEAGDIEDDMAANAAQTMGYGAPLQAEPEASGNAESDTVQLFGVRSDGTEVLVGTARTPPKMKAREIVRQMFGEIDEEAGDAGAMALWCCEQLIDWLGVPAIADARATTATPAAREAESGEAPELADKIATNTWDHLRDVTPTVSDAINGKWHWFNNPKCKYIELRIDMRTGHCLLKNRDGDRIDPSTLRYQYPGETAASQTQPQAKGEA